MAIKDLSGHSKNITPSFVMFMSHQLLVKFLSFMIDINGIWLMGYFDNINNK